MENRIFQNQQEINSVFLSNYWRIGFTQICADDHLLEAILIWSLTSECLAISSCIFTNVFMGQSQISIELHTWWMCLWGELCGEKG